MSPFLAKLAAKLAVKKAPEIGKKVMAAIAGIFITASLIAIMALNMIGTLFEQKDSKSDVINSDYDITETEVFGDVKKVYDIYMEDVREKFEKRKAKIIEENTYTVTKTVIVDGKKQTVTETKCDVTVSIDISSFSMSYVLAYINHTEHVKKGVRYSINQRKIKKFFKDITDEEETVNGLVYTLRLKVMAKEDVASKYYSDDQTQQMYIQSFDLYEEFLGWLADNGLGGDTAYTGSISLDDIDDAQIQADIRAGKYSAADFGYMYATILGECNSSNEGAVAVGQCIMNRVANGKFPSSVQGVCTAPGQFIGYQHNKDKVNGPYTNTIVKNAAVACLKKTAPNPIGDYCFFFGRVSGYDLWYEFTKGPKPINVGGNVYHAGGGYVHNKQNSKTSDAVIIWSASEGKWY